MRVTIEELKDSALMNQRLVYNSDTGNYIDVKIYLSPLRTEYIVGKTKDVYNDLEAAVNRFNELEYQQW